MSYSIHSLPQKSETKVGPAYDVALLLTTIILCLIGAVFVWTSSAAHSWQAYHGDSTVIFKGHLVRLALGIAGMCVLSFVNFHIFERTSRLTWILSVAGLILLFFLPASEGETAKRWIHIAGFSFQPAELAKYALIFYLSMRFSNVKQDIYLSDKKKAFLGSMIVIGLTALLVVVEPNLSMALLICGVSALMLLISGIRMKSLIAPAAVALTLFSIVAAINPYMQNRISHYFKGITDPLQSSYHVKQSLVGIGQGGLFGVGLGQSTQKHFFLPEPYNDFIFSIVGEELGFAGTIVFLLGFVFLLSRGWKIAKQCTDPFGYFLAAGITFSFALSFVINIGVTLGLLPATGQPLPFISYGGTSLVMSLCAIGILLNISARGAQSASSSTDFGSISYTRI